MQTIYLAYGTKASVLAAAATRLVAGDEDPASHPGERAWAREILAAEDPRRKIALYVEHIADVAPRTTALIDALRATARSEPEVGAFLEHMEEGRREGPLALLGPLADAGLSAPRPQPRRRRRHRVRARLARHAARADRPTAAGRGSARRRGSPRH